MAPERAHFAESARILRDAGVVVAVGHTAATFEQAREAIDAGATLLTHAFNGMPGVHHRAPGPVLAFVEDPDGCLEVINDGVHVRPEVIRMLFRLAPGRVALVSDAMSAAGAGDGRYRIGNLDVDVAEGVARLTGEEVARRLNPHVGRGGRPRCTGRGSEPSRGGRSRHSYPGADLGSGRPVRPPGAGICGRRCAFR